MTRALILLAAVLYAFAIMGLSRPANAAGGAFATVKAAPLGEPG